MTAYTKNLLCQTLIPSVEPNLVHESMPALVDVLYLFGILCHLGEIPVQVEHTVQKAFVCCVV